MKLPRKKLAGLFESVMTEEIGRDFPGQVNLILTDDKEIRKLNKRFRKKDKATDVLSFNLEEPVNRSATLGEIFISVETANRQAKDYEALLGDELMRLFCHGLLHLAGYDHVQKKDRVKMEKREQYYLGVT